MINNIVGYVAVRDKVWARDWMKIVKGQVSLMALQLVSSHMGSHLYGGYTSTEACADLHQRCRAFFVEHFGVFAGHGLEASLQESEPQTVFGRMAQWSLSSSSHSIAAMFLQLVNEMFAQTTMKIGDDGTAAPALQMLGKAFDLGAWTAISMDMWPQWRSTAAAGHSTALAYLLNSQVLDLEPGNIIFLLAHALTLHLHRAGTRASWNLTY
jgi:hypothetical protein|tara:strand:- start:1152 stop:1784 length:633 start_codon:yes stop_codon:yes gene_type:complete